MFKEDTMTAKKKPTTALPLWKRLNIASHDHVYDSPKAQLLSDAAQTIQRLQRNLRALTDICDNVPIFQLDQGKASVKAVRLAGKFTGAHTAARALLAELGE